MATYRAQSDVDVLVVVDGPLTADQRTALMRALDAIAPATGRRFDLEIVTAEAACRARRRPTVELYYGAANLAAPGLTGNVARSVYLGALLRTSPP